MAKHSVAFRARRKRARDRRKNRQRLIAMYRACEFGSARLIDRYGDSVDRADEYYSARLGF